MKRYFFLVITLFILLPACRPVISRNVMDMAAFNPSLADLNASSASFKGNLFVFGGKIINTRLTKDGSLIEALYVSVSSKGYIKDYDKQSLRFLALMPKEKGILDPLIFKKDMEITIAAIYRGTKTEKLEELDYQYSYFEITEIYLWQEQQYNFRYDPYPFWLYDPWYYPRYPRH
ncbi:MAG: Slp family lipoprotein [Nitrospiraceae bacterium]|nr:Slp family lipoprotein [Nitrospiraceae bacterium]